MPEVSDQTQLLDTIKNRLFSNEETKKEDLGETLNFVRIPFTMTCDSWQKRTPPEYIIFRTNPMEAGWELALRASEQKTRLGTILHVWKDNARKTFFDEPIIDFTFQSGNIIPVLNEDGRFVASSGVKNFYKFIELIDEQKTQENGEANMIHIMYSSTVFPIMVLSGLFSPAGMSWPDSSDNPFNHTWKARFTVRRTFPKLGSDSRKRLNGIYTQAMTYVPRQKQKSESTFQNQGFLAI